MKQYNIKDMQQFALIRDGRCLSDIFANTKTKLKWECKDGHIFWMLPKCVIRGQWCPDCAHKTLDIEAMKRLAENNSGKCLSDAYVNTRTKLKWQCEFGHVWEARQDVIKLQKVANVYQTFI